MEQRNRFRGFRKCSEEIHYVPIGDGWEEVLVHTFLGPNGTRFPRAISGPQKKSRFSGPTPSNAPRNVVAPLKTITYRTIKTTGPLIVITFQGGRDKLIEGSRGILQGTTAMLICFDSSQVRYKHREFKRP
jgi:hypothetical protein